MVSVGQKIACRGRDAVLALTLACPWGAGAEVPLAVPSGQDIALQELFLEAQDDGQLWLRMRFLAPQIARESGTLKYADVEADFQHLCETLGLARLDEAQAVAQVIIVSMMDRDVPFGATDPQATQFFEAFRRENATCIWEGF